MNRYEVTWFEKILRMDKGYSTGYYSILVLT